MHRARRTMTFVATLLALGAGCGAPLPTTPLAHTFADPEHLARAVLDALAHNDVESLSALALTEREFREHVWPELPASRPERNLPFDYVWGQLKQRSDHSLRQILARYGGRRLELVGVDFDGETTRYTTFLVRRASSLRVKDHEGQESNVKLFGSVMVQAARHKLFSFVVD